MRLVFRIVRMIRRFLKKLGLTWQEWKAAEAPLAP